MKLKIELVPKTAWFDNLRSQLTPSQWKWVKTETYKQANYRCEICGGKGEQWLVKAHEEWNYDEDNHLITLKGVHSICPMCHKCKHIGLAQLQGHFDACVKHLNKVNQQTEKQTMQQIKEAMEIYHRRSKHGWKVDIENVKQYLRDNGIK